jgi:signal transduction histidine kinase
MAANGTRGYGDAMTEVDLTGAAGIQTGPVRDEAEATRDLIVRLVTDPMTSAARAIESVRALLQREEPAKSPGPVRSRATAATPFGESDAELRLRELSALLEGAQALASTLDLEQLLDVILDQIKVVAEYDGAVISVLEGDTVRILRRRSPPAPAPVPSAWDVATARAQAAPGWDLTLRRQPVIIGDIRGDEPLAQVYRATLDVPLAQSPGHYIRAWMSVPLALPDRVFGRITLASGHPHAYTEHHARLVTAFATQAAAAIENARLYGEAHKLAALEERQRLSRELHDSVSQALFGIGLGARTAQSLLARNNAARALGSVEYVISLAEAGMAEMRALLFELRPDSLASEGLVAALTKQAAVLRLRHELAVDIALCAEPDVSMEVKEAIYRIAQEALHNIVKHAGAATVAIQLVCDADGIALSVRDDGVGFDPSGSFPGHIGQHSMRERAERLGGRVSVVSALGEGSCVRVLIPSERG